eukprot:1159774-Pelagomonas_calceolata.AAC.4
MISSKSITSAHLTQTLLSITGLFLISCRSSCLAPKFTSLHTGPAVPGKPQWQLLCEVVSLGAGGPQAPAECKRPPAQPNARPKRQQQRQPAESRAEVGAESRMQCKSSWHGMGDSEDECCSDMVAGLRVRANEDQRARGILYHSKASFRSFCPLQHKWQCLFPSEAFAASPMRPSIIGRRMPALHTLHGLSMLLVNIQLHV